MPTRTPEEDGSESAGTRRTSTKHDELTQTLREMIVGMQPGDKLPTQEALMRQFQVSDTTVLRSLEDLKRDGWIVRRQGSGTFVADTAARQTIAETTPAPERGKLVAVMSRPSSSPFFSEMLQAVEANLQLHDMAPVLIVDTDVARRIQRARAYWSRGEVIGAIHIGSAPMDDMGDLPTILIGETERNNDSCQVSLDNSGAGRSVGEYLWDLGHRGVIVVTITPAGASDTPPLQGVDRLRVAGLRALWEQRGGTWHTDRQIAHPYLLQPEDRRSVEVMRSYLEPLFASPTPPTALFAVHDEMALVAIRTLEEMELQVPGDVSVIGFNDSGTLAACFRPSLTTVRTPSPTLGMLATHLFQDLLKDPDRKPRSIRLPAEIIVRESSGPPPQHKL